jgi:HEPN domain-containing protein
MKPPEDVKKRIVNDWLDKANADMALAEHLLSDETAFPNAIAFHCQQAAEKYLKALLTWWGTEFPKTHELARLIKLVETHDTELAASMFNVTVLTPYGVELRYPGDRPNATQDEAHEAVKLARQMRDSVLSLLPISNGDATA